MRDWGKTIAMDLIRWVLLFFDACKVQPVTENPTPIVGKPLAMARSVRVRARGETRLSRGPTALHHRSDL